MKQPTKVARIAYSDDLNQANIMKHLERTRGDVVRTEVWRDYGSPSGLEAA